VFSTIITKPLNTLVERCEDEYANMTCKSDKEDEIAWTYDGNTEINSPCRSNSPDVFQAVDNTSYQCDISASLTRARINETIKSISGPYGCTDRSSGGVTATSIVVVMGTFWRYCCVFASYFRVLMMHIQNGHKLKRPEMRY